MRIGNLETVKLKIQRIKLGLLKATGNHALDIHTSCLIEVLRFTDDNYLWCITTGLSSSGIAKTHNAKVKLKFIRKEEGLFMKLNGRAEIIDSHAVGFNREMKSGRLQPKPVMLKIKIDHADCFQKRSTSRYTSFLQSVSHFTGNKALAGSRY